MNRIRVIPILLGVVGLLAVAAPVHAARQQPVSYASPIEPLFTVPMFSSLTNASVDETAGAWIYVGFCDETTVYITWGAGVTVGGVTIDTTDDTTSAATPAPLTSEIAFSGTAPNKTIVQITGLEVWVRSRVSTAITGGTVSTRIGCK